MVRYSFDGGLSSAQAKNAALQVVELVGHLPAHLEKWARDHGQDSSSVERTVAGSFALQVVIDLANSEKHPGRKRDGGKSKRNPKILEVRRALRIGASNPGEAASVTMSVFGPGPAVILGDASAVISGAVVGEDGGEIGELDQLLTDALSVQEALFRSWRDAPRR